MGTESTKNGAHFGIISLRSYCVIRCSLFFCNLLRYWLISVKKVMSSDLHFSVTNGVDRRNCTNVGHNIVQFLLFYLSTKYSSGKFSTVCSSFSTSCTTIVSISSFNYFSECFLSFKVAFVVLTDYQCLNFCFYIKSGENSFGKEQL